MSPIAPLPIALKSSAIVQPEQLPVFTPSEAVMAIQNVPKILVKAYLKRYPIRARWQQFNVLKRWVWIQPIAAELQAELFPSPPEPDVEEAAIAPPVAEVPPAAGVQPTDALYRHYACPQGDTLRCEQSLDAASPHCSVCGFPALLPAKATLAGLRGSYQIDRSLGRRGRGRLYAGMQLGTNQPVVIKEYLLPSQYFNAEETRLRQTAFKSLVGLSLADGRTQDFRMLAPIEAIVDERQHRCYVILNQRYASPSLNQALAIAPFTEAQVRLVLNQVLQSLECLHGQKFRLPAGQVQTGLIHGNLSLDSLLLVRNPAELTDTAPSDLDFMIELCDLALWEHLFDPPAVKAPTGSIAADLAALGYISFYLLAGRVVGDRGQALDPRIEPHWGPVDPLLKDWILRLLGIEAAFESAAIARQALLRLPIAAATIAPDLADQTPARDSGTRDRWLILLLSALGVGILGWLLLPKPQASNAMRSAPAICCLSEVGGIPEGRFTYTSAQQGIWNYVLQQPDLIQKGQTLEQRLQLAQPKLSLNYVPATSTAAAIAQVQSGLAAFAIVPLTQPLPDDLTAQPIAYDGLAIFVPFSYSEREQGLPTHLKGREFDRLKDGRRQGW